MWLGTRSRKAMAEKESPRELPYDVDVEQALLGVLLTDNYWFEKATLDLKDIHFYDPLHQRMYAAMLKMWGEGMAVTPLTLKSMMENDEGLVEVGGQAYLLSLARSAPSLPNVKDYVQILIDLSTRRDLIRIGEDMVNKAFEAPIETKPNEMIGEATAALFRVGVDSPDKRPQSVAAVANEVLKTHERRLAGDKAPVIKSGLDALDSEIGGFRAKLLTVIAGRSGMGKSALMGGIALCVALAGAPVLIFSLEMAKEQWVERTLCDLDFYENAANPLRYQRFANFKATAEEFDRMAVAANKFHALPLEIIDSDQLTIEDITAISRAHVMNRAVLGLIIIDYLQIVQATGGDGNREQQVTHIARGAKSLAKQTGWHVMAGCQLLNKGQKADDDEKRPTAADIRESGQIEMEADLILAPWRKAFFLEQKRQQSMQTPARKEAWIADYTREKNKFELLGLKHRHGRRFDLDLWCDIGASAIRDSEPLSAAAAKANRDAQEMLI